MPNMSYCRFENTSSDFADCISAIKFDAENISEREREYAKTLYEQSKEYIEVYKYVMMEEDEKEEED